MAPLSGRGRLLAAAASGTNVRVAIIGAGIAGLNAALTLHDHGVAATVYEGQDRVGGRMHSERAFWEDGQTSEYCAELIDTDHTLMRALARRFALPLADVLAAVAPNAQQTIFERGSYYPQRQLFRDFRPVYHTLTQQVLAAGPVTTYDRSTATGRALDAMNLTEWIHRFVPGGLHSKLGEFIDLQYVAEYGIAAHRQSSLNLVYWLGRQPYYDARTGEFVALGPSDERYHIIGGNDRLPRAMAAHLPPETVRFGHRLEAIVRRPDGRIALTFATASGTRTAVADKAIVTIPFSVLRRLDIARAGFDARKLAAIDELGYGEHSKLIVQFDDRYWRGTGAWPGEGSGDITYDGPFIQTWDASRAQPGRTGLIVDYAAARWSAELRPPAPYTTSVTPATAAYGAAFAKELEAVWPGATQHFTGKAVLSHPTFDPFARGSYSGWLVGQYTRIAGYERVRQGNVLFAGEHCSVIFQGFMEGAAREGARAAREVLHDLTVPALAARH
ncbi:MAG: FAD-dependent oxidoreductase [Candidatus Eremiobacteraeota bacterium]|nr:FAD-dependent oxidoreductase [Candidatus Eremiobacteraeota bacterium]